jgi:fatty acid desaturase
MLKMESAPARTKSLQDPELKEKVQRLRQTDNYTNLYYLARTYILIAGVIGGAIWFYHYQAPAGLSFWWNVPLTAVAIALIGALQHQLTGLAHEASHHLLFRNRYWNELASDWLCMFPLFSTTHHYRLQHLAHHQFVNDPDRDPDVSQLRASGHWLNFPLGKRQVLHALLRQLWPPRLLRYMRVRAQYNAVPTLHSPYLRKDWKPSRLLVRVGIAYLLGLIGQLMGLVWYGDPFWLAVLPAACWVGIALFYALVPLNFYHQSRVHSTIAPRWMTVGRMAYATAVFTGLAWLTWATGEWVAVYYFLLWVVPIFTAFSFFMILRQLVQHGNAGRGWLTNTRVFLVQRLIQFSIFPIGQDYHLPHHLFATVPHYRLRELHETLLGYDDYRAQAVVVEGYCLPAHGPAARPTVLDVLGPDYVSRDPAEVFIDNSVLEGVRVDEKAEILREGETAIHGAGMAADRST